MGGWDDIPDAGTAKTKPKAKSAWDTVPDAWADIPDAGTPAPPVAARSEKELRSNEQALGLGEQADGGSLLDKGVRWFKKKKKEYDAEAEKIRNRSLGEHIREGAAQLPGLYGVRALPEVAERVYGAGQALVNGGYVPWGADTEERNAFEVGIETGAKKPEDVARINGYLDEASKLRAEAKANKKAADESRARIFGKIKGARDKYLGQPTKPEALVGDISKLMVQAELAPWSIPLEAAANASAEGADAGLDADSQLKYAIASGLTQKAFMKVPLGRLTEASIGNKIPGVLAAGAGVVSDASAQTAIDSLLRQRYGLPISPDSFQHNLMFGAAMRLPHGGFGSGVAEHVPTERQADLLAPGTPQPTTRPNPAWDMVPDSSVPASAEFLPAGRTVVDPARDAVAGNAVNPLAGSFKRTFHGTPQDAPYETVSSLSAPESVLAAKSAQDAGVYEAHRRTAEAAVEPVVTTLGQQLAKDRLILASLEGKKSLNRRDQQRANDLREKIRLAEEEQQKTQEAAAMAGKVQGDYAFGFANPPVPELTKRGPVRDVAPQIGQRGEYAQPGLLRPSTRSGEVQQRVVPMELSDTEQSVPLRNLDDVQWAVRQIKKGRIADMLGLGNVVKGIRDQGTYFNASGADIALARHFIDVQKRNASNPDAPPRDLPELTPGASQIVDVLKPEIQKALVDYTSARVAKGEATPGISDDHIPRVTLERGEAPVSAGGTGPMKETSSFERSRTIKAIATPEGDVPISIDGDKATDANGNTYHRDGNQWFDPDSEASYHEVQATKADVETAFPRIKYLDDPLGSILLGRAANRDAARVSDFANRLVANPELAVPDNVNAPRTWQTVEIPGMTSLKGYKLRPDVANTIRAEANAWYKGGGLDLPESGFAKGVTRAMNTLISLHLSNPIVHWPNEFDHAFTSFEGKNGGVSKEDYLGHWIEAAKHLKSNDATVQEAAQAGLNLTTGATRANAAVDLLRKSFNIPEGSAVLRDLGADREGVLKILDSLSDKMVWNPQDINMLTNYLAFRKKGASPVEAAKQAHDAYVSYEVPTQIAELKPGDSPQVQSAKAFVNKIYGDYLMGTTLVPGSAAQAVHKLFGPMFVKYHYGVIKQLAEKGKLAFEGDPKAADKATALATLSLALYPAADQLLTNLFGDDETKYHMRRGGSTHAFELATDPTMSPAQKLVRFGTPAVGTRVLGAGLFNTDINKFNKFATTEDTITGNTGQHWRDLATEALLPHGIAINRAASGDEHGAMAQMLLGKKAPSNQSLMNMYKLSEHAPTPDEMLAAREAARDFRRKVDEGDESEIKDLIPDGLGSDAPIASIKAAIRGKLTDDNIQTLLMAKHTRPSIVERVAKDEQDPQTRALMYLIAAKGYAAEARKYGPESSMGRAFLVKYQKLLNMGSGMQKTLKLEQEHE